LFDFVYIKKHSLLSHNLQYCNIENTFFCPLHLSLFAPTSFLGVQQVDSPLQGPTLTAIAVLPVAVQVQAKSVLFPSTAERREDTSGAIRGHTLTNLLKTAVQAGQAYHHLKFFVLAGLTPTWLPVRTKNYEI
jgi:hypothetical protein